MSANDTDNKIINAYKDLICEAPVIINTQSTISEIFDYLLSVKSKGVEARLTNNKYDRNLKDIVLSKSGLGNNLYAEIRVSDAKQYVYVDFELTYPINQQDEEPEVSLKLPYSVVQKGGKLNTKLFDDIIDSLLEMEEIRVVYEKARTKAEKLDL